MNNSTSNAPKENVTSANAASANAAKENATSENAGDAALDMLLDDAPAETQNSSAQTQEIASPIADAPTLNAPPAVARLDAATAGLQMQSETDAPFRTVYWPLEKDEITPSEVALYLTENADARVETQSVEEFFKNAVSVEDWMNDDEKATAQRFERLAETLDAELEKPRVYRIGEREISAAIIGKVPGGFAGVVTTIVET